MHKGFILATALVVAFGAVPNNHGSAMTRQQAYTYAQQRHAQQEKEAQIAKRYEQAIQAYQSGNYSVCINYLSNNYVAAAFQRKTDYNIAIGDSYYKLGRSAYSSREFFRHHSGWRFLCPKTVLSDIRRFCYNSQR